MTLWLRQTPEKQNTCAKAHFSFCFRSALDPSLMLVTGDFPAYHSSEIDLFQSLVWKIFACIYWHQRVVLQPSLAQVNPWNIELKRQETDKSPYLAAQKGRWQIKKGACAVAKEAPEVEGWTQSLTRCCPPPVCVHVCSGAVSKPTDNRKILIIFF